MTTTVQIGVGVINGEWSPVPEFGARFRYEQFESSWSSQRTALDGLASFRDEHLDPPVFPADTPIWYDRSESVRPVRLAFEYGFGAQ